MKTLLPRFFEDVAKVMFDFQEDKNIDTGELELLLNYDKIKEPTETRNDEQFTVVGQRCQYPDDGHPPKQGGGGHRKSKKGKH